MARVAIHSTRAGLSIEERGAWFFRDGLTVTAAVGREGWTVTHEASGYGVMRGINSLERAIDAAEQLLRCGDWTRDRSATIADEQLHVAARGVAARLHRQWEVGA